MNSITTIIDADTICYLVGYNLRESNDVEEAERLIDTFVELILKNTNCTHYLGFLGEDKTFRHNLYSEYKANRPAKPDWLDRWGYFIKNRLVTKWKFMYSGILEAEDCCSICIEYFRNTTNIVYAHIDKDGNSVGDINHYDYSKHQFWYTDKFGRLELIQKSKSKKLVGSGLMWLYAQYLKGDSTDNIPSLKKGFGDVAIYNLLKDCTTELQLMNKVYQEFLKHSSREAFIRNRILVKMLDSPMYGFIIPEVNIYKKEEINIFEL